jgi:hypothetical protein
MPCNIIGPQSRLSTGLVLAFSLFSNLFFLSCKTEGWAGQGRPRRVEDGGRGATIRVRKGDDLQAALNEARAGDTLILEAGATFVGPFTLPAKSGNEVITIQTAARESLPAEGVRIGPDSAVLMPKIVAPGGGRAAIETAEGAHHYSFIGIEFKPRDAQAFSYNLISLGVEKARSESQLPHHILFDHCYIHTEGPSRRGIALNSGDTEIRDSYIAGFREQGADSQAICGWNGPGPFRILNNYIEGAGENILFGGADPSIPNLVPSDILIRGNYITKPLSWRDQQWVVKNLLELKNARRVVIEGNLIENLWTAGQNGTAILFTPRNQNGAAPWTIVADVTFQNNVVRHAANAISILATDDQKPSQPTRNLRIINNLFYDIYASRWSTGGGGMLVIFNGLGTSDVEISHNTVIQDGRAIDFEDGSSIIGLKVFNNIFHFHIIGGGMAGTAALQRFAIQPWQVVHNIIVTPEKADYWQQQYPSNNVFPEDYASIGFANPLAEDFRLRENSPYKRKAADGKDIGCDLALGDPTNRLTIIAGK